VEEFGEFRFGHGRSLAKLAADGFAVAERGLLRSTGKKGQKSNGGRRAGERAVKEALIYSRFVIPAQAGIQEKSGRWAPAFAGATFP
jgi:hypothetical protein